MIFFQENLKDARCWNEIKIVISYKSWPAKIWSCKQNFPLWLYSWRKEKIRQLHRINSNENELYCSKDGILSIGSDDEIDENKSQQEISPILKHKEIRAKFRNYYDAGILAAESIRKDIPWLIYKIFNHYKIFNGKMTNSKKKGNKRNFIFIKDIGLKIKNLI